MTMFADMPSFQYLMVDVVTNHMAYMGCGSCVDYSRFNPFSSVYSVLPRTMFVERGQPTDLRGLWVVFIFPFVLLHQLRQPDICGGVRVHNLIMMCVVRGTH